MNKKQIQEQMEKNAQLTLKRMEECGNDYLEYARKYNRHTLKISLTNEQTGTEIWEGSEITFFNEDNAISHLGLLNELLEELTKEENRDWGTGRSNEALVERLTNFVREKVSPPNGHKSITEIAEGIKKKGFGE